MINNNKPIAHPFAKKVNKQLSRRVFSKGIFVAGAAFAVGPLVLPNLAKASTGAILQTTNPLQEMIAKHLLLAYNNNTLSGLNTLDNATRDDAFHTYLAERLHDLHPASSVSTD
jgi:secreted PhoX family phosphatase